MKKVIILVLCAFAISCQKEEKKNIVSSEQELFKIVLISPNGDTLQQSSVFRK